MKVEPRISVIIPAYNSAQSLSQAIESVLEQSLQDFEIIVVDDGSTDNTLEVARSFQTGARLISQPNGGPGSARNAGINSSSGEYLVFLDADDILLPDKLVVQSDFLDQNPDIGVVFSDVLCFSSGKDGEEVLTEFPTSSYVRNSVGPPEKTREVLAVQNIFPPLAAMVRRGCVESVGGFDESRDLIGLEDWDLWFRIAQAHDFYYLDKLVGKYCLAPSSVSQDKNRMKRASRMLERKMQESACMPTLSTAARSDFYFSWGVQWLDFGEPGMALDRFSMALAVERGNLLAWVAYILTRLIGKRAVFFYYLKRRTLGLRGNIPAIRI
jgi:glycosyltransferase involved in cell wall biosynthesis